MIRALRCSTCGTTRLLGGVPEPCCAAWPAVDVEAVLLREEEDPQPLDDRALIEAGRVPAPPLRRLPTVMEAELRRVLAPVPLELVADLQDHLLFRGERAAGGALDVRVMVPHGRQEPNRWRIEAVEDRQPRRPQ